MFNIAKATEKLMIEYDYNSTGVTSTGEYVPDWRYYKTIYASVTAQKGTINFDNLTGAQNYKDNISFYCMYNSDFTDIKAYRIIYNGRMYVINNITTVPFNQAIIIDLTAVIL